MIKAILTASIIVGTVIFLSQAVQDPEKNVTRFSERESTLENVPDDYEYNLQPHMTDSAFMIHVLQKYNYRKVRIDWKPGRTMTGKEIIRYAVIWFLDEEEKKWATLEY